MINKAEPVLEGERDISCLSAHKWIDPWPLVGPIAS